MLGKVWDHFRHSAKQIISYRLGVAIPWVYSKGEF